MRSEAQPGFFLERLRGFEPNVNFFAQKLSNLGSVMNELMQLKRITERAWGAEPPTAG